MHTMGMFDYFYFKKDLPLTDEIRSSFPDTDWKEVKFQTKDFDNTMSKYTIEEDGNLYTEVVHGEYIEDSPEVQTERRKKDRFYWPRHFVESSRETMREHITATVDFYDLKKDKDGNEWWIEFRATLVTGELKSVELLKAEIHSTKAEVEESHSRLRKMISDHENHPWTKTRNILNKVTFGGYRKSVQKISRLILKAGSSVNDVGYWFTRTF